MLIFQENIILKSYLNNPNVYEETYTKLILQLNFAVF